jgi:hypothetical protein
MDLRTTPWCDHGSSRLHTSIGVAALSVIAGGAISSADVRSMDGSGNNLDHPAWGARGEHLLRLTGIYYADGVEEISGPDRPNARAISNIVFDQPSEIFGSPLMTNMAVVWGQFIDHDLDRSQGTAPSEFAMVTVPECDPVMDPECTGLEVIFVERSHYDKATGTDPDNPRMQDNDINAFIDASNVYGNWDARADALRSFRGGKLRVTESAWGDLLPMNTILEGMDTPPFGVELEDMFIAGDDRANEQLALTALHTVFHREHNRLCDELALHNPDWTDEQLYQHARKLVGGILQHITYNEFLPAMIGANALPDYAGYDAGVNPGVSIEFSTFAYRFGHTMINPAILRLEEDGTPIPEGNLDLRDAFFAPEKIIDEGGIDPILRGMAVGASQKVDAKITNELRNFLFTPPTIFNLDLATLNIQRGRDHGLGSYNEVRVDLGLAPAASFDDITSDRSLQAQLAEAYDGNVDLIDPFVGGLAEDPVVGSNFGELFQTILADQFTRVRDGDRFWYQNDEDLSQADIDLIESTTLAGVIKRNTDIVAMQSDVFFVWPDFDKNGVLNLIDFITFQMAFKSGDQDADMDKDGKLTILDFVLFQTAFTAYS